MTQPRLIIRGRGLDEFRSRFKAAGDAVVVVGVLQDSGHHRGADGQTVAQVAAANEYGTDRIPERPAFRQALDQTRPKFGSMIERGVGRIVDGKMTVDTLLGRLGATGAAAIQKRIVDLDEPPNSPRTIARKGSSNPLIASGQLRQSVTFDVRKGAEAKRLKQEARRAGRE